MPSRGSNAEAEVASSDSALRLFSCDRRLRTLVRVRRRIGRTLLLLAPLAIALADAVRRPGHLGHFDTRGLVFYALSVLVSGALWVSLVVIAARKRGATRWLAWTMLVVLAGFALGAQSYTYARYMAYMDHQAVLVGTSMMPSIGQQLWSDRTTFAQTVLPPVLVALLLPFIVRSLAPPRRRSTHIAKDFAIVALLCALYVSPTHGAEQGQPPDVMYLAAIGQLSRARWDHNETVERVHPGPRSPEPVPDVHARPRIARNVVFVLTESVRAMSVCTRPGDKECLFTPYSNAAAPNRIMLHQMRSVDSTTAISLSVLWSGLAPDESRQMTHSAPLLWEYLHAAQLDSAYWTSQNMLFGNSGAWLGGIPMTRTVSATQLEREPSLEVGADDGKLVDYVLGDIGQLREPFTGVVHLSNTHFPYKVDHAFAPFLPEDEATGPGYEREIRNRYHDAVHLQDRAVGHLVESIRARPEGSRTIIVYLSDHGEQLREKGAVGHTGTLYEEEIRIPFWIDAPRGTLTEEEERNLRALENRPVTTLDVFPTVLDLMGLLDEPRLASFRARMPGESLLRGGSPEDRAAFLTNCTELWACAFKNWGAIRGSRKLIGNQADHAWNCFDVATDPEEHQPLPVEACGDLVNVAETRGHGRPF
ncbi:sulfatase-like hydrolase/transferase [Pendulispora brunnea]|uniref:Sulfatase-like hydrolase/transferase n=1 Tax=Pendulispora brunnea TaxID=2905690 RepID=A0ABZ2KFE1_9BACT